MSDLKYNRKYQPLFRTKKNIRYKHVTGGRGSGKSHALSVYLLMKTYNKGEVILYTRYTMVSASLSIIPEFYEKIEQLNVTEDFETVGDTITNKTTGSRIIFKGIKTSSGNQTAALKSINGLTCWVLDEAEELIDESIFDKIDASIRSMQAHNEVILVYNAPYKTHWIYKRFYEKRGVTEVFNGAIDDTQYIYTTYLDNKPNLSASFLSIAEKCKVDDPEKYDHIYLGHFASHAKGLVYNHWKSIRESEIPKHLESWYAIDFGFSNSKNAIVRCYYDKDSNTMYYHEVDYVTERQPKDILMLIREDYLTKYTLLYEDNGTEYAIKDKAINWINVYDFVDNPKLLQCTDYVRNILHQTVSRMLKQIDCDVICDSARPEAIRYLAENGVKSYPCIKGQGSIKSQISMMKDVNIYYTRESVNIAWELGKYSYPTKKNDEGVEYALDDPIKMYDDLMDACRYGYCTRKIRNLI